MAETLFIDLDEPFAWHLCDADGEIILRGTADDLGARRTEANLEVVVTVPTRDVLRTTARVPSRHHRQILQAIPYAVEEQLAMDVENCFFALGGRTPSGAIEVAVTGREKMETWTDRLEELGIVAATMLPVSELIPWTSGVEVLVDGPRATLRWNEGAVIETDTDSLAMAIALIDPEEKSRIDLHASENDKASLEWQMNELGVVEKVPIELHPFRGEAKNWLYRNYLTNRKQPPVNLLQGEYKVELEPRNRLSVWRPVVLLAVFALVLHLAGLLGQGLYFSRQASVYEEAYKALYKEIFPSDARVHDYRRRWNSHLGKSSGEGGQFLALLARSSEKLESGGLTLSNINYNESRGDLVLQVTSARSETLVEYAQALSTLGLESEIGTISQEGKAVRGSIKVRAGGLR